MADSHCAELGYCALSFSASAKSCAAWRRSCWRSFMLQRIMLELSALKRVVYFHISRVPRLTFFLSTSSTCMPERRPCSAIIFAAGWRRGCRRAS